VVGAFSLGDIAVGTAASYVSLRYRDLHWHGLYPDLAVFCDRLAQRLSFKKSVPVAQTIPGKVV
jgi:glutathione S-transferase